LAIADFTSHHHLASPESYSSGAEGSWFNASMWVVMEHASASVIARQKAL
jgi:hypothetical protein